jgi:heat shock transcription factor
MQRNYNPLKRAAPGTSPSVPQNVQSFPVQDAQHLQNQPDPQYYDWDQAGNFKTPELPGFEVNDFAQNAFNQGMLGNGQMTNQGSLAPGTGELVRRNANQQLARPTRGGWDGTSIEPPASGWVYDDDEELAVKALEAKREALSKKRQIPPFVQKLSRYVRLVSRQHNTNYPMQFSRRVTKH